MKKVVPFVVIYFMAVLLGVGLLFLVSLIPQSILTEHWQGGRETDFYLSNFSLVTAGDYGTYMDDLKIDIAYRLNEHSIITPTAYIGFADMEYEYGRYWHGYCITLRPILVFFNLLQIKVMAGAVNLILFAILIIMLIKNDNCSMALSLLFAAYLTNFHIICMSLQYFNCTFISILAAIIFITRHALYERYKYIVFFMIGILVCYFDLLTFETVTLTMPLVLAEMADKSGISLYGRIKRAAGASATWFLGYLGMFLSKWLLYGAVRGPEVKDFILFNIIERTTGSNTLQQFTIMDALKLNFGMLKHFTFGNWHAIILCWIVICALYIYFARGVDKRLTTNVALLFIGMIPVVRFILITEHSATHAVFTYHALLPTAAAAIYPFIQLLNKLFNNVCCLTVKISK